MACIETVVIAVSRAWYNSGRSLMIDSSLFFAIYLVK